MNKLNFAELARLYSTLGYKWRIGGEHRVPTEKELSQAIDKLSKELYDSNSELIEMGRLLIIRDGKHYDVYTLMGEVDDPGTVHQQD